MAGKELEERVDSLAEEELFEEHVKNPVEEEELFQEQVAENLAKEEVFGEHTEDRAEDPGKQLQCTLCSQPYRKPLLLPCLHSFCESCLEDHQRDVCGEGEGLTCPITFCQNPTDEKDVQKFTTNIWLKNRISINEKVVRIMEGQCDICVKRTKAAAYCTDCWKAMCGDCQTNWHDRNRANKNHKPIRISSESVDTLKATLTRQVQSEAQEEQQCCSHHGEKQCEFFCYECDKPSCSFCLFAGACKGHRCDCIPNVVERFKEELSNHLQSHNDSLEKLDKAVANCEDIKKRISTREREVEEDINTAVKAIMDTLMKQKKKLMGQCHEIAQSKRTRLDLQIEQLTRTKHQIEHCSEVISTACDGYSPTEFLAVRDAIISRHKDLNTKFEDVELLPCTTATIVAELGSDVDLGFVSEGCCPELSILEVPVGQPFTCEIGDESQIRLVTRYEDENLCDHGGATVKATIESIVPDMSTTYMYESNSACQAQLAYEVKDEGELGCQAQLAYEVKDEGESGCQAQLAYEVKDEGELGCQAQLAYEVKDEGESGCQAQLAYEVKDEGESGCQADVVYEDEDENFDTATAEATPSTSESIIPVNTTDNHDGTYSLSFTPTSMEDHQLIVKVFGCRIKGSPFQVKVSSECDEIQALMSKRLTKGEKRYLVSHNWMTKWKQYYQPSCIGNQDFHPGPVDNSTLLNDVLDTLQNNLKEGRDYDHLPQLAWNKLVGRYGLSEGSRPIVRTAVCCGYASWVYELEVYPLMLKIRFGSNYEVIAFSRDDTICDVKKKACKKLAVSRFRLKRRQSSTRSLSDYEKLSSLGIRNEEVLFLEIL